MKIALSAAAVVSLVAVSAEAASFTSIVSFGDSLSDVGNLKATTFNLVPGGPGYFDGRFSNGPVWVEQLAPKLGVPVPTRSTAGGSDYAYGNTTSGTGTTSLAPLPASAPNLRTQIDAYAATNVSTATQLFTVLSGANDLFAALSTPGATAAQQTLVAQQAAANVTAGVAALYADGGRNVLVSNLPDLGSLPRYLNGPAADRASATAATLAFNAALAVNLAALDAVSPDLNVYDLRLDTLFTQAQANPAAFGLTNVTGAAYTGDPAYLGGGSVVANPSGYLFWDEVHPTTLGHSLVAAAALAAVPEPTGVVALAMALPLLRRRRVA